VAEFTPPGCMPGASSLNPIIGRDN